MSQQLFCPYCFELCSENEVCNNCQQFVHCDEILTEEERDEELQELEEAGLDDDED